MKGPQAIRVIFLISFLIVVTKGKDVRYKKQEEDNTQILTYQQVNKTIQMEDRDIYDCVDVNEQPTLKHPLFRDHKIQMEPSSFPIGMDIESLDSDSFSQVEPSIIDCPPGTIPILRSGNIAVHNIDGLGNDMRSLSDGLEKKNCIDFSCLGFVQVNHKIVLGGRVRPLSVYGGVQRIIGIQIFKDPKTWNWWVTYQNISVGYWPSGLFEFIKNKGDLAFWGGFVAGPTALSNSPQMGSGHFASEGYRRAAYIRSIMIADENDRFVTPDESNVEHGSSDTSKYTVDGFEVKDVGMRIYYGGPGSYTI